MHDVDPDLFASDIEAILKDIKRVDYINLLISQLTETLSSELQYILPAKQYSNILTDFELKKGTKVKSVCKIIAQTLRTINSQDYILSIYTS